MCASSSINSAFALLGLFISKKALFTELNILPAPILEIISFLDILLKSMVETFKSCFTNSSFLSKKSMVLENSWATLFINVSFSLSVAIILELHSVNSLLVLFTISFLLALVPISSSAIILCSCICLSSILVSTKSIRDSFKFKESYCVLFPA